MALVEHLQPSEADPFPEASDAPTATSPSGDAASAVEGDIQRLSANDWCDFEEISKPLNLKDMPQSGDKFDCECTYNPAADMPSAACGEDCLNRQIMIECDPKR